MKFMGVSNTYPLSVACNLSDDKQNYIKFYLAPKINDD